MATESPTNDAAGPGLPDGFQADLEGDGAVRREHGRGGKDAAADDHRFSEDSHKSAAYHDAMQTLPTARPHPRAGARAWPAPPPPGVLAIPPDLSLPTPSLFLPVPLSRLTSASLPSLQDRFTSLVLNE